MCCQFLAKKVHFLPPKHASRLFSNEFSQHFSQESFDGDSFVSQSRFDAYAGQMGKSACTIGGRSKRTRACDGGGGVTFLPFWCVRANVITPIGFIESKRFSGCSSSYINVSQ